MLNLVIIYIVKCFAYAMITSTFPISFPSVNTSTAPRQATISLPIVAFTHPHHRPSRRHRNTTSEIDQRVAIHRQRTTTTPSNCSRWPTVDASKLHCSGWKNNKTNSSNCSPSMWIHIRLERCNELHRRSKQCYAHTHTNKQYNDWMDDNSMVLLHLVLSFTIRIARL